ncbi:unnamed protein product [Spirodela intermedia]|uniref:Uncharacterized protein n=1 Tax=Spirodela intermedia TaxID=51605 RepID=A0A7I8IXN6_SPIIN|nr:unnamed protein product [Spirodela intermedia]CAA6662785.1 unnamed protein product [Spirodela intermedia]
MAALARVIYVGRRSLSRRLQTAAAAAAASSSLSIAPSKSSDRRSLPPLLTRLLREPESSVKMVLDSDEESGDCWRFAAVMLRSGSNSSARELLESDLPLRETGESSVRCEGVHGDGIRGIRPNTAVFNSLILAALSCGNVVNALSLFEIMRMREDCDPDLGTYNALIAMYSRRGDGDGMLGWYAAAKSAGFSPDLHTYEALITGFIRAGRFEDADRYFEEMASSGIIPNVGILECVLSGLCRRKKLAEAKEFWRFLIAGGWEVEEGMVEKILALYAELGRVEEMEELLETMQHKPSSSIFLPQVHCGVIRLYASSNRLDDVEYSVGRMLKNGMQLKCSRDVEAIISCYFRCEAYERLDIFLERVGSSYRLSKAAYDLLVAGYRRVGLHEKLELVKKEMKNRGVA